MKRPWFVPSTLALASAVFTFVLLNVLSAVAAVVVPQLLELMRTEPRLAALGFLGLVVSPGITVVVAHHFGHHLLDKADAARRGRRRRILPGMRSWWAGALAWLVLFGSSTLTSFVLLVIHPPKPDPHALADMTLGLVEAVVDPLRSPTMSLYLVIWISIAAIFFELERRTRGKRRTDEGDDDDT